MSKANPRKAMAALLPLPINCGSDKVVVRPMTLGMYAALERLESPLVTGAEPKDSLELIPSLYLLTHDPREVFRGDLIDRSMEWADSLPVTAMSDIQSACYRQINAAFDVIPEPDEDESDDAKKKTTGGSRPLSTGPRRPTAGDSARSCGKSPCPPSRSSGGRKA